MDQTLLGAVRDELLIGGESSQCACSKQQGQIRREIEFSVSSHGQRGGFTLLAQLGQRWMPAR